MATVGQVYYNVIDNNSGKAISTDGINIFTDIVSAYVGGRAAFNKLGIQAPPGTRVVMNNSKTIMVGRTGIYELDEDISVTSIYFVRPRQYIKDEEASQKAIQDGINGMLAASEARQASLDALNARYPNGIPTDEEMEGYQEYWNEYNEIQSIYIAAYKLGLDQFNTGTNGIYVMPDPQNPNSEVNYKDLYNVIVDFVYEIQE